MAIPAMITAMGNQQANYGASVADSLRKLGDEVGKTLVMQQFQKEAAAELPFMQQAMQSAMGKIGQGDVAGGYMDAMMALPLASQNPIVQAAANNYFQGMQQAAEFKQSSLWRELQYGRMGGGGVTDVQTEVVYETPTAEQMADPNYRPVARIVPKTTPTRGGGGAGRGAGGFGGGGSARDAALAIDQSTPLPGMEAEFTDTVSEMDTSGEQGGFGFGWSYEEGYRPSANKQKSFEREYNDFLNAPVEEQQKVNEETQVSESSVPSNLQVVPFRMALYPEFVGIVGPKSSSQVEEIIQTFKGNDVEARRKLIAKDPLAAAINDLQKADSIISGNNTLMNVHEQVKGDYSRVTTDREFFSEDAKNDKFKIFIDGNEIPRVNTDANGAEAINIMKAKAVAAREGKYEFVRAEAAPAEEQAAPQTTADKVRAKFGKTEQPAPAPTPAPAPAPDTAPEFSADNPFAEQAKAGAATPVAAPRARETTRERQREGSARKNLEAVKEQIKNLNNMKVGRRNATPTEKARRWEELNAEKKRLEGILAQ